MPAPNGASDPPQRAKPKQRVKKPAVFEIERFLAKLDDWRPNGADSPPAPPPQISEVSPKVRKRTIMGRYVLGDELKPGERWKRLLRKTR
jgi:hypothetical protein